MSLAQLTILAPGLLGGSVARAARARSVAQRIVIWSRRPESRAQLRGQPWCDATAETAAEAVRDATLVVIAAPVDQIVPLAKQIAPHLRPDALVTDVGSVKGEIAREGHAALAGRGNFVGAHPMAGSEKTGWEHSSATLFERRTCFVTPLTQTASTATETVSRFWRNLGAEVVHVAPEEHDRIVAHISHLPQVLASCLCAFLAKKNPAWRDYAGGGLRDTTRIAASDPNLWRTILEQNREEILGAIGGLEHELLSFKTALANQDYSQIVARLEQGRAYRSDFRPTQ